MKSIIVAIILAIFTGIAVAEWIAYSTTTRIIYGSAVSTKTATQDGRIDIEDSKIYIGGANTDEIFVTNFSFSMPEDYEPEKYMLSPDATTYYEVNPST